VTVRLLVSMQYGQPRVSAQMGGFVCVRVLVRVRGVLRECACMQVHVV
jgi:hypothetical protein